MRPLCDSIQLLTPLNYCQIITIGDYTVVAGSFFGLGPRFLGAFWAGHSWSFESAVNSIVRPFSAVPLENVGELGLFPVAGNGQSFPPYDFDIEWPHCAGFTFGGRLSWSWILWERCNFWEEVGGKGVTVSSDRDLSILSWLLVLLLGGELISWPVIYY